MKLNVPKLDARRRFQDLKRWLFCWQWGCEPEDNGRGWTGQSGRWILFEPTPCKRCGTMMGVDEDGKA